jgi:hypothetical protein
LRRLCLRIRSTAKRQDRRHAENVHGHRQSPTSTGAHAASSSRHISRSRGRG